MPDSFELNPLELFYFLFLAVQTQAVNGIKECQGKQGENENRQVRIDVPEVRQRNVAIIGYAYQFGHEGIVGKAKKDRAYQETQQAWDDIVQFPFTGTRHGSTWAEARQGHTHPEDQ
jgi:hypothetical protein